MIVKNYRDVRAEPVLQEPGVTVRWLISELDETPRYALRLYEIEPWLPRLRGRKPQPTTLLDVPQLRPGRPGV
ncbi:MAG: hypothetical protein JXA93_20860, partial [Anaerolineae bacterium]|nr:hypothetical protein [Anaerolineae bacterium]